MGIRSYYVRTEDGIELLHIQTNQTQVFRPVNYGDGPEYQVMFDDSILDEGMFVYDYVSMDGSTQDFQLFLNRNCIK